MEKITQYVENLFFDFPKTEEVALLKMQIIDSLFEKYQDLISSGKNEDESFGIVVAEFGNIEELKKEFDISDSQRENLKRAAQFADTKKPEKKHYPVYEIIMPLATIIFFILGFVKNGWHPAWIIFPIAALVSRIIQIMLDNHSYRK